ncbi:nucleotidyltransferase family protein [Parasutterella sp.]|uniref:nucleotidyltransferase family protein n=1 Tax=Parasutterella sp. TaxID=2049037 RepID=UPI003520FEDD
MRALILAGGKGTRLKKVVSDVPKPLAPVCGKPFLDILLKQLKEEDVTSVILSTGHMAEVIESRYAKGFEGLSVSFSREKTPLLTGGAIKKAIDKLDSELIVVLNGDSFVQLKLKEITKFHQKKGADITVLSVFMQDASRYGLLKLSSDSRLVRFCEKQKNSQGYINAGVYVFKSDLLRDYREQVFSFEEWLKDNLNTLKVYAFVCDEDFIDIGIPEDYERAQNFFANKR